MTQRKPSLNLCLKVCAIRGIAIVWNDQLSVGYYKDEAEFLTKIEEDSITFKPHGDLIHSYTRPSPAATGKGKGVANLSPESEDAVVYEVYHVCGFYRPWICVWLCCLRSLPSKHRASKNTIEECSYLYFSISKVARILTKRRINGSSWLCEFVRKSFAQEGCWPTLRGPGSRSESEEMIPPLRHIISLAIRHYTTSTISPKKFACDWGMDNFTFSNYIWHYSTFQSICDPASIPACWPWL